MGLASVDLGVNALASIVVEDGAWLLYKGVRITEVYFHLQGRIFQIQSLADRGQGSRGNSRPSGGEEVR
ncbi:MAG: transposase [Thermocladium sp.]